MRVIKSAKRVILTPILIFPRQETVSQCHSEASAEESVLCNVLNA